MNDMYNLNQILNNIKNGDANMDWNAMYSMIREFVAKSARGNRRIRIMGTPWYAIPTNGYWWIKERLIVIDTDNGLMAQYVAGQDWNYEMRYARDMFDL